MIFKEEIPSPSQIRTVEIPDKLINYIKDFYNPGMMLLTGTPDRPMEARTLKNRFDRLLAEYHMENIPFQRLRKTYIQDKTKIEALDKVF